MKQQLEQFALEYDRAEESLAGQGDDQSSIHYPALYLFIGDKTGEAIGAMKEIHDRKWDNSRGVMYLWVTTAGEAAVQAEASPAVKRHVLAGAEGGGNPKTARAELYRSLYDSGQGWFELNRTLRQVSSHIAEYGRLYASFDRIHLSVVTRVDDPLNVFVQELSLLAKSILSQSFKSVQMDLYALIREREQVEAFGYGSSTGVAFLRELDYMQQPNYSFSAPLQVTEDGISIPVTHQDAPLFDLVYVLSDRNERGLLSADELQDSYEMISHISLLKNRKYKEQAFGPDNGSYNNTSFKNNVMTESGRQGYVSAGMAKLKRPNQSIALVVLYHLLRQIKEDMAVHPEISEQEKLAMFGMHPAAMEEQATRFVPDIEAISEMHALMTHEVSYASLRQLSLREAEQALYGEGCRAFFQSNYEGPAQRGLEQLDVAASLENELRSRDTSTASLIGVFQLYHWSGDHKEEGGLLPYMQSMYRDTQRELELAHFELEQAYEGRVEQLSFKKMPFMDKRNVRGFISELFRIIYHRKRDLLLLEIKLKLISRYEAALEALHKRCEAKIAQFEGLEQQLRIAAQESVTWADDYIGQNIMEYYELVTKRVTDELKAKRGAGAFFEDRLLGKQQELLEQGTEGFLSKLIKVCREHILTSPYFKLSFEEELLQRSNVTIEYNNKEVLSKDDLFKKLYRTLEERAAIQLRLYDYTQEHRYEEKYVFGDVESEFVRYVFSVDEASRMYKLGGVHEKRSSGIVKLNLMGGFHLEDLMYYRNGKVYYESYVANGYEFHGLDHTRLPELR